MSTILGVPSGSVPTLMGPDQQFSSPSVKRYMVPQLDSVRQCSTAAMMAVPPSGTGMTNLPCARVPFVIAATAVRSNMELGPDMLPERSTKSTIPPTAVWSTYISTCLSLNATTMYISSVGAFWTFCTPLFDAPCFCGASGGTGVVFCGGVDGDLEAMMLGCNAWVCLKEFSLYLFVLKNFFGQIFSYKIFLMGVDF